MSGTDSDEIVITGEELTVNKRLDRERFEHLGVIFEIRSERADAVDIRLIETVPAHVPTGFHPEYYGADWSMDERTVVFERTLEPGEELTTLYGLGVGAMDSIDQFRTEPTIELRPRGQDEYTRLDAGSSPAEERDRSESDRSSQSSMSDLASTVADRDKTADAPGSAGSAPPADRPGRSALPSADLELRPAIRESIDELESIEAGLSGDPAEQLQSASARRAVGFHVEAILFHIAHLREDLPTEPSSSVSESPGDPRTGGAEESESSADELMPSDSPNPNATSPDDGFDSESWLSGPLDGRIRPVRGIPFLWIVTLLGLWTVLSSFGLVGRSSRDLLLAGTGSLVVLVSAFAWVYPEEKQPVRAILAVVVVSGLAILVYPFLFGAPRSINGLVTIGAGVLITTIPMVIENRRWQTFGILRN